MPGLIRRTVHRDALRKRLRRRHAHCAGQVSQPTLVIATRNDRSAPFAHAEFSAAAIPNAELADTRADSHLIWFGPDYPHIAAKIRDFLAAG
ncbi:alpha/beta fold hydrolase [Nonomuraea angiospora]|uniref:Pimeloyl-ACP methyl ester carboxylesterase n=1 Tax=Nonomuraea angiospora TaxID=46172 RepID=A0ABR9M9H2_9ACTN|nr:hypothetical protein [Nonomuraea angiospora]MBE1589564.1 pimeloyl-ACP methyl ester carboxylesterase [Nonomuraea angiospora]